MNKEVLFRITRLKVIRVIAYLPHLVKHGIEYLQYQASADKKAMYAFGNKHEGKRCFIIGNGPSLTVTDLEAIKNEYTFGVNNLSKCYQNTVFRPSYYLAADYHFFRDNKEELIRLLEEDKSIFLFYQKYAKYIGSSNNVIRFFHNYIYRVRPDSFRKKRINTKPYKYVSMYNSVVCIAMEIAIFMGFKEIYLIGVDFSQSDTTKQLHFYSESDESRKTYTFYEDIMLSCFHVLNSYAKEHGISILNVSKETQLDVFPKVNLEGVI